MQTKIQNILKRLLQLHPKSIDLSLDRIKRLLKDLDNPEKKLSNILEKHGLKFTTINFLNFVKNGLIQREKLKFEFTKNLSAVLELLAKYGKMLGITREELSHADICDILKLNNNVKSKESISKFLSKKIKSNITKKIINNQ